MSPGAAALIWSLLATGLSKINCQSDIVDSGFKLKRVRLCLKPEFIAETVLHSASDERGCSWVCVNRGSRCHGFRLTGDDGSVCQTFEFGRCDRELNEAGCNRFEQIFVRSQRGLPLGKLCSDGFGNRYLDSTYKMIQVSSWTDGLNKCHAEPGELTTYAEGLDRAEVDHFHTLRAVLNGDLENWQRSFYVGGKTDDGTNWYWRECGSAFLPEVWGYGQPNGYNAGGATDVNRANVWYSHAYGLDDEVESTASIQRALCECIDPFE